jgi:hypothetical protein
MPFCHCHPSNCKDIGHTSTTRPLLIGDPLGPAIFQRAATLDGGGTAASAIGRIRLLAARFPGATEDKAPSTATLSIPRIMGEIRHPESIEK